MKRGLRLKGQISLFIIVGILIGVVVGVSVYSSKINNERLAKEFFSMEDIKPGVENIQMNVLSCIDETGKEALDWIGNRGGYYDLPQYVDSSGIPYYYYEGNELVPSNETIARELKKYMDANVDKCLDVLNFPGFELKHANSSSSVIIEKDNVVFKVDNAIVISKENKSIVFHTSEFPISRNSSLRDILEISNYFVGSHRIDSRMYCLNCVSKMAEERNVYFWQIPISNDSAHIIIGENITSYEPYLFNFLVKYSGEEMSNDSIGNFSEGLPGGILL